MAKMVIEFDTDTKSFTATVDGTAVANAVGAEVYPDWSNDDNYRCNIIARSKDEGTGITEIRQLMAAFTGQARAALKAGAAASADFPGFVDVRDTASASKAHKDIAAAFGCAQE